LCFVPVVPFQLGMLNDNRKLRLSSFSFCEHSNQLTFSNSANAAADVIDLAATEASVYNCVTSHTEVECGKEKLWNSETHCAVCCREVSWASWRLVLVFIRTGDLQFYQALTTRGLFVPARLNQRMKHWLTAVESSFDKPLMVGLVTAGHAFMDMSPPYAKACVTSFHYVIPASFMHSELSAAVLSNPLPSTIVNHCAFGLDVNYHSCCAMRICGAVEWQFSLILLLIILEIRCQTIQCKIIILKIFLQQVIDFD